MINRLTRGSALVGKIIGTVQAAAGSIGSTELAARSVTPVKLSATYDILTNTTASTTTIAAGTRGNKMVTNVGSSKGVVVSGAGLSVPTAGDRYTFTVDATPSTIPIHIKSTAATFNAAGNKYLLMNAVLDSVTIEAVSTIRWNVVSNIGSVVAAAAT